LEEATSTYSVQLNEESPISRRGREYLRGRALARTDVVGPYRLGVVAEPLPGDEQYRGKLVIPCLTLAGVRGLTFRCIEDHKCGDVGHSKYTRPYGQEQRLFNALAYFGGHDTVGVAEGEIDAITATVHLGLPTFGVPGATQWDKHGWYWQLVFRDFAEVIIFADGDKDRVTADGKKLNPGRELAAKIANDAGPGSRIVWCDDGEDVNSMVVAGRGDVLRKKAGL
jgi:hypothetical protein